MKIINIVFIFLLTTFSAKAQNVLLLEDAMQIALENNLNIKMTTNQQLQAANQATYGNAGLLPKVDLNGATSYGANKSNVTFAGGFPPIENQAAELFSYNAGVSANYMLFNGLGSINTYYKLQSLSDLNAIQLKLSIESILFQVANVYYEVAKQQEQLEIAKQTLNISKERYKRIKVAQEYGTTSSLFVLNSEVDMNADSSLVLNLNLGLKNAKRNLNILLARDAATEFTVNKEININESILLDSIQQKALANNNNLLLAQTNITVAEYSEKIQKAFYMPKLAINASYGYNYSENSASVILNQNSLGFTGGATLAWNLFDGGKRSTALQNAKIALETSELKVEEAKLTINKDVLNAYDLFQNNLDLLKLEERSAEVAQQNFERSKEMFNQGQLTTTQFREAQLNLSRAKSRLNTTLFTTKMAEISLIRLSGELVK